MNIYSTPTKHCKTITFKPETIDDGFKVGLIKAKLDNHRIPHNIEIDDYKINSITITDFDLVNLILGVK